MNCVFWKLTDKQLLRLDHLLNLDSISSLGAFLYLLTFFEDVDKQVR